VLGIGPTRLQFEPLQEEYPDRIYFGVGSGIAAIVAEEGFRFLRAPIVRVAGALAPFSAAPTHEAYVIPKPEKIGAAVKKTLES
jgi:pyruvate/2-oxoglutarate/acetoin dehydrogenase E1 component